MKAPTWLTIIGIVVPVAMCLRFFINCLKILLKCLQIYFRGIETIGEVVNFEVWEDETGPTYAPIVKFKTQNNTQIEATAIHGFAKKLKETEVNVKYNPLRPQFFYVTPAPWPMFILLIIVVLGSGIFSLFGIIYFIGVFVLN